MLGVPPPWLYATATAAAVVVGIFLFLRRAARLGIAVRPAILLVIGLTAAGLLGGRLYMLLEGGTDWEWPALLETGYRHPGAIVGLTLMLPLLSRLLLPDVPFARFADCLAPPAAFAIAVVRWGCFAVGCCFGTLSNVPWAVRFPAGSLAANLHSTMGWIPPGATASLPVHPLQLYFSSLAFGTGVFLLWLERRKSFDGEIALAFLAIHEVGKFSLEPLRAPASPQATMFLPIFSLIVALLATAAFAGLTLQARRRG